MFKKIIDLLPDPNSYIDFQGRELNSLQWSQQHAEIGATKINIKIEIKWARRELKRNDRIVYYLKMYRMNILDRKVGLDRLIPTGHRLKLISEYKRKERPMHEAIYNNFANFVKANLKHFIDFDIPAVNNVIFAHQNPHQLIAFLEIELHKWQDKQQGAIKTERRVFLKINPRWAWYDLESNTSSEEAEAMGHCSTGPIGTTCLSLREKTSKGFVPHLTFIFDSHTGELGEMKGRRNQKPDKKYHKFIIPLLKDRRIKGFESEKDHYMSDNNFDIYDLSNSVRERIYKKNPSLDTEDYWHGKPTIWEIKSQRFGVYKGQKLELKEIYDDMLSGIAEHELGMKTFKEFKRHFKIYKRKKHRSGDHDYYDVWLIANSSLIDKLKEHERGVEQALMWGESFDKEG